jgi:hypothetical protein
VTATTISLPVKRKDFSQLDHKVQTYWTAIQKKDVQAYLYPGVDDNAHLLVTSGGEQAYRTFDGFDPGGVAIEPDGNFLIVLVQPSYKNAHEENTSPYKSEHTMMRLALPGLAKAWEVKFRNNKTGSKIHWDTNCRGSETLAVSSKTIGIFCSGGMWAGRGKGHQSFAVFQ